jgi:DNA mismatch repair ATPase MutS
LTDNEISSDNEIVQHVTKEEEANSEMKEHPHEQDLVPTKKVSHSSALRCVQSPMDYMEQQDRMMLQNLWSYTQDGQSVDQISLPSFFEN